MIRVEGSYNSNPWSILQEQNISDDMNGYDRKVIYRLNEGIYDSFKFTTIGKNHANTYHFLIYQLDFFGTLFYNGKLVYDSRFDRPLFSFNNILKYCFVLILE